MGGHGSTQRGLGKAFFKTSKQVLTKDRRKKKQLELGPKTKKLPFNGTGEQRRVWGMGG